MEVVLSKVEDLFKIIETLFRYSVLTKEEWQTVRSLAGNKSIIIKKFDKGSSVVISDVDYMKETNCLILMSTRN